MKKLNYLFSLLVLISFFGFMSCGGGGTDDPTIEEQQKENLVGTWETSSTSDVKLNGSDAPGDWSNFSIMFSQSNGVSVSGDPTSEVDIFSVSTYSIDGTGTTAFTLIFNNDNSETANVNISGTNMTMTFNLDEGDQLGSKVMSVSGTWTFNLVKQQ